MKCFKHSLFLKDVASITGASLCCLKPSLHNILAAVAESQNLMICIRTLMYLHCRVPCGLTSLGISSVHIYID